MTRILLAEMRLPFPPSVNHIWLHSSERVYSADDSKRYKALVQQLALLNGRGDTEYYIRIFRKPEPKTRLKVEAVFFLPDNRKRDLDNLPKVVFDGMTKAELWTDDSQIFELHSLKYLKRDYTNLPTKGRVEMQVYGDFE